jgi:hypothetical protein
MNSETTNSDRSDDLEQRARAEVRAILGQSVPLRASTLAEAVAEAEKLREKENILLAINSLWAWFSARPDKEREAVGQFRNARDFWMTGISKYRRK